MILDVTLLPFRTSIAWVEGNDGLCWKGGHLLYAWWVSESATMLRWAGKGEGVGVCCDVVLGALNV